MQAIRYRVWIDTQKEMYDITNIRFTPNGLKVEHKGSPWTWNRSNPIVVQYIALKDVKGFEIYEGDVVKDLDGILYEVKRNEFGAVMLYTDSKNYKAIYPTSILEIIGNIYSHPNLKRVC